CSQPALVIIIILSNPIKITELLFIGCCAGAVEQNLFCASGHGSPPKAARASEKSEPKIPRWGIFGAFAKPHQAAA
ncbi:MAG: hypothetical protein COU52_00860, partial [Candidatus Omnitrophica bacterium CG10_big_fil_rev_8_21_14_0_10_43_8]